MADQGNRQLNKNKQRRVGGQLLLVFLFAAILIATLAAAAMAEDGPGVLIDREGDVDKPTAEELQYRQILQRVMVPNADIDPVSGCLNYTRPICGNANEVDVGQVTNVTVTEFCDDPAPDTLTFTATYQVDLNAATRYDIGLWVNTNNTGSAELGTVDDKTTQCQAAMLPIVDPNDNTIDPSDQEGAYPNDTCGDITGSVNVDLEFTVSCDQIDPTTGVLNLPYCTTWNNGSAGIPFGDSGNETIPSPDNKCFCQDDATVANDVTIEKTSDLFTSTAFPQFTYTIVVTNDGPGILKNVLIEDTLPPYVKYISSSYTYSDDTTPPTGGNCHHTGEIVGGTVTCDDPGDPDADPDPIPPDYMPDLGPAQTITLEITVELIEETPDNTDVINNACLYYAAGPGAGLCASVTENVPVTLTYFAATTDGVSTNFDWSTSSETANAGFNVYALVDGERVRLNDHLILSAAFDSSAPQDYGFSLDNVPGTTFYIEDVPVLGDRRMHGPFELGEVYGTREEAQPIDWAVIQAEHEALGEERAALAAGVALEKMEAAKPAGPLARLTDWAQGLLNNALGKKPPLKKQLSYPEFYVKVDQDGLYRLTYEEMVAATGVGLAGVPTADLALTNRYGAAVPIYITSGTTFGPGSQIEFYARALDTLYTDTNVLTLSVDPAKASRISEIAIDIPRDGQAAPYYLETASFERNNDYSYLSTTDDPWYDTGLIASAPQSWHFNMAVDNYVPTGGQGLLTLQLWGANDVNHHVKALFNGQQVADLLFADRAVENFAGAVDIQEGANTLTLSVPNDQGAEADLSALEAYGLVYPRSFVARDDQLSFSGADDVFTVTDLSSPQAVVYRLKNGVWQKLTRLKTQANGGAYSVSFAGSSAQAEYHVATEAALLTPEVSLAVTPQGLIGGEVDLLIISHPNFIDGLEPLVTKREAQGYQVKVVNVEELYAAYSGGVFDAQAIKAYIYEAIDTMGVQYVLLVGGDTYDYRGYDNPDSMSFVPSLYAKTTDTINYAPVDPLFTDTNNDNVPDAPIGRFPVRTLAELQLMVDKTFQYESKDYQETAVFAADKGFSGYSEDFMVPLQADWTVDKAYISESGAAAAKSTLINSLNDGVALANFVGHSGKNHWTFDPLLLAKDVAQLTNYGEAALVSQWGCWNTYYVDPNYNTMAHAFLLSGTNGAAVVTGSTTITEVYSEHELGKLMMPRLVEPGITVGEAMQAAKAELAQSEPDLADVLLGWTILGDPTVMVQP